MDALFGASLTDLPELVPACLVSRAHLDDECDTTEEDSVVAVLDERLCLVDEVVNQVWDPSDDPKSTQRGLSNKERANQSLIPRGCQV